MILYFVLQLLASFFKRNWINTEHSPISMKSLFKALYGLQDLSSLTRDWTQVTAVKAQNPNH